MNHTSLIKNAKRHTGLAITMFCLGGALIGASTLHLIEAQDAKAPAQVAGKPYDGAADKGREFLVKRDYTKALESWKSAVAAATTPKETAIAQVGVVQSLIGTKDFAEAEILIQKLQATPEELISKTTLQALGISALQGQGRYAEAKAATDRMLEASPENFPNVKFTPDGKVSPLTQADIPQLLYGGLLGDISGKTPAQVQAALEELAKNEKAPAYKREQAKVYVGDFLLNQNKPAQARESYLSANVSSLGLGLEFSRLSKIADTYLVEKNWQQALKYYDTALGLPNLTPFEANSIKAKRAYVARFTR